MKKIILIVVIVAIVTALCIIAFRVKPVTLTFGQGVDSITIYTTDDKKINHVSENNQRSWLFTGDYYIVPAGSHIKTDRIPFSVTTAAKTTVDPDYTDAYLKEKTPDATNQIQALLTDTYTAMDGYIITSEKLYRYGDWYGATLFNTTSNADSKKDFYRFVAHYNGQQWKLVQAPQLVLSKSSFTDVPAKIIDSINESVPDESLLYEN